MKTKKEIVRIDGREINTAVLARWTDIAVECYERGCNCRNCTIIPDIAIDKCRIKDYVRAYFLIGLKPPIKRKEIIDDSK